MEFRLLATPGMLGASGSALSTRPPDLREGTIGCTRSHFGSYETPAGTFIELNAISKAAYFYQLRKMRKKAIADREYWGDDTVHVDNFEDASSKAGNFDGDWLEMTLDSGAGATVYPFSAPALDTGTSRSLRFQTATGERLKSGPDCLVQGRSEGGATVAFRGCRADVRQPLVSVGDVTDQGNMVVFAGSGGFIVPGHSEVARQITDLLHAHAAADASASVPVHKESGVYKFYLRIPGYNKVARTDMSENAENYKGDGMVEGGAADFPRPPLA